MLGKDILIRDVPSSVVARLRARARRNRRSLHAEAVAALESATTSDIRSARKIAAEIRRHLSGRKHSDSTKLIRRDRSR